MVCGNSNVVITGPFHLYSAKLHLEPPSVRFPNNSRYSLHCLHSLALISGLSSTHDYQLN